MWCARCRRHVAAIVGDSGSSAVCANCGDEVDALADLVGEPPPMAHPATQEIEERAAHSSAQIAVPHFAYSRARLDHIGRRLNALAQVTQTSQADEHAGRRQDVATRDRSPHLRIVRDWIARIGLFSGLVTLSCGAALAGWSLVGGQAQLWDIGLPMMLLGQFLLLVALASQMEFRAVKAADGSRRPDQSRSSRLAA